MPEKTYRLRFKVKDTEEWTRVTINSFPEDADVQGIKEMYAMRLEKLYNCPVECVGVEEIRRSQKYFLSVIMCTAHMMADP